MEQMKRRLKEYIDLLEYGDMRFMQQIYTLIVRHLKKTGRL